MSIVLDQYYNRHDADNRFEQHLFRSGNVLQGSELNELQSESQARLRAISDALFKDGDVISGADCVTDPNTGACTCEAGVVYLRGAARGVAPRSFTVPIVGLVLVGVYLVDTVVTEIEDPSLRDPAVSLRNYQEPGAARLRVDTAWGYEGDGQAGDFYPVYQVENGVVLSKAPPPQIDAVAEIIARYDRQSAGGFYVSSGLTVTREADVAGDQVYSIASGVARVGGNEIVRNHARRVVHAATPDTRQVSLEPKVAAGGTERVDVNNTPIVTIIDVSITKEETVTLTHGPTDGYADLLPHSPAVAITLVQQGPTTYTENTDYLLTGDTVDWSPAGQEPAPGSAYDVTYRYIDSVAPGNADETGFEVTGAVPGTLIQTTYTWAMPRYDLICLDGDGNPVIVKGVSAPTRPRLPSTPGGLLKLCVLDQRWTAASGVINDAVRLVPMNDLNATNRRVDTLFALVAEERLALDLTQRDPTAKKGVFTDPFIDDDLRDAGIAQSAAIFDQQLTLGADVAVHAQALAGALTLTVANHVAVISQTLRTGAMQVNPYMAFSPIPATCRLTPAVDFWTEVQTQWLSPFTRQIGVDESAPNNPNRRLGFFGRLFRRIFRRRILVRTEEVSETEQELVGTELVEAQFLRQITVEFALTGFGPGETLASLLFDGRALAPEALGGGAIGPADANGDLAGQFTIPAEVPAGEKLVEFTGSGGTLAAATFVGRGLITLETLRLVTTIRTQSRLLDPLAQTFVLPESRQVSAIRLWFTAVGTTNVLIEIRDVSLGLPTLLVAADVLHTPAQINTGAWTTFALQTPVFLEAGHEYCFVIACDDAVCACAIAALGEYDGTAQQWVTSQPYQIGTLLSAANNRTWTPHQTSDLAFEMLAVDYASNTRTVALSDVSVTDADHLMILAAVERPTEDCDVLFRITADGVLYEAIEAQPVTLAARYTGVVQIEAVLSGTAAISPTLHKDVQLVAATRHASSDYVTRAIQANGGTKITAYYDALLPAGATVDAYYESTPGNFVALPVTGTTALGDGWSEIKREVTGFSEPQTRIKLVINGSAQAIALVENLRVAIT